MRPSGSNVKARSSIKAAWNNRARAGDSQLNVIQRQFLPAALEVQEQPPSPAGRSVMWLLLALFTIGVIWAALGEVDIVVTAPGRVIPSGQVKVVQAPESGTVQHIYVKEGELVQAGQALVSLDPIYANADDVRITEQIAAIALQANWRQALDHWLEQGGGQAVPLQFGPEMSLAEQSIARSLYEQYRQEITARLSGFDKELSANAAEQNTVAAEHSRARATLDVLAQRVSAYETLLEQQYGAKVQYLEMLQQQTELERTLPVLQSKGEQLLATAAAITARQQATAGELRKQNLMELTRLASERETLEQESLKARQRQQQLMVVAPVTGAVQELAVHTIGGVVTPAQILMKVVPGDVVIEVEALLPNKDIGFVTEGQLAEVKIDTFNFTKYGLIDARIVDISNDVIEDQQLGWVFKMRLSLEQDSIVVAGKKVRLSPGMTTTAEIKTGKRRLIEFFLSPLLRYKQESVRER